MAATNTTHKRALPLSPPGLHPLDESPAPQPPPFLRQPSSLASYTSTVSSSLGSMEEDVEGLVMSFLTYPEVRTYRGLID